MWRWLYAGARMTVRDKQPLEQMLAGCTHASLVPTQLWRLLVNRSSVSLKAVLLGGAAIPIELTEQAREQGIRCFCGYGLTEFASTVCAKEADGLADVGSPLPGREVKIVNNEVWLRAASMAEGYWRNGQLVSLVNDEGWYATRDRGEVHNGKLTIVGTFRQSIVQWRRGYSAGRSRARNCCTSCGFAGVYRPRCRQGVWSSTGGGDGV